MIEKKILSVLRSFIRFKKEISRLELSHAAEGRIHNFPHQLNDGVRNDWTPFCDMLALLILVPSCHFLLVLQYLLMLQMKINI